MKECVWKNSDLIEKYKLPFFSILERTKWTGWGWGWLGTCWEVPLLLSLYWIKASHLLTCLLSPTVRVGPNAGRLQAQEFPDSGRHVPLPCCHTQCVSLGGAWGFPWPSTVSWDFVFWSDYGFPEVAEKCPGKCCARLPHDSSLFTCCISVVHYQHQRPILMQHTGLIQIPLATHTHWVCSSAPFCHVCSSREPPSPVRCRPVQHARLPHATPCPPPRNHWSHHLYDFVISRMSYKWNHTECEPLRLTSFTRQNSFEVAYVGLPEQYFIFLLPSRIPRYRRSCLRHRSPVAECLNSFWFLAVTSKAAVNAYVRVPAACTLAFLLGWCPRVPLLGHPVGFILKNLPNSFPEFSLPFSIPTSNVWMIQFYIFLLALSVRFFILAILIAV